MVDEHAALAELGLDPARQVGLASALGQVVDEHLACLSNSLRERRIGLDLVSDEHEDRRRGWTREVLAKSLEVGRLPALDVLDDHETALDGKETEGVAGRNHVLAAGLVGREDLCRVIADSRAEPAQGTADLGTVGARDQVDRGELCHRRQA